MHISSGTVLQAALGGILIASPPLVDGKPHAVPLRKARVPTGSNIAASIRDRKPEGSVFQDHQGFWFGHFDIGDTKNASILLDTGSPDLLFNPGHVYKPGPESSKLNRNFSIVFGTTNSDGSGFEEVHGDVFEDTVTLLGTDLRIDRQPLGVTTDWKPRSKLPFPEDGLIGFGQQGSTLGKKVIGWFDHLCAKKMLDECRFGLAFGTDETGMQYYGGVGTSEFDGDLTVAPIVLHWALYGDLAVNGEIIQNDAPIQIDSGTTTMIGPIDQVKAMFEASGIDAVPEDMGQNITLLKGYYDCDKPPQLGFQFPSYSNRTEAEGDPKSPVSHRGKIFNITPMGLKLNSTGNRCLSTIQGQTRMPNWLIGQSFMEGKYVDHNHAEGTMGFATLK